MPAAKGTKRGAKAQGAAEQKKPRTDPTLKAVLEGISQADDLPQPCKAMLSAVAPGCFEMPASERHEHQATLVTWIGNVLDGVRSKLQDTVDEANNGAAGTDATKAELAGKIAEATTALTVAMEGIVAQKSAVAEATEVVTSAKAVASEAQAAHDQAAGKSGKLKKEKETLEAVLKEDLPAVKTQEDYEAGKYTNVLTPIAKKMGLEDSLVLTIPTVLSKKPSERGPFDAAVLDQVEAALDTKVRALEAELAAGASSEEECRAAAEKAQGDLSDAEQKQQAAASQLQAAEAEKVARTAAMAAAEAALEAFKRERAPEEAVRKQKMAALENFTSHNLQCFATLRDKAAPAGA